MKPFASTLDTIAAYQGCSEQLQGLAKQLFEVRIAAPAREFVQRGRLITGCPVDASGTNMPGPMPAYLQPDRVWLRKTRRHGLLVNVSFKRNYALERQLGIRWNGSDFRPVCFPLAWLEAPDAGLEKLREFHEARKARIAARVQKEAEAREPRLRKLQAEAYILGHAVVPVSELTSLQSEIERLKKGGCARDQRTTQFCAEAVALARPDVDWELNAGTWRAWRGCFWLSVAPTGWTLWARNADGVYTAVDSGEQPDEAGRKACYEAWLTARG